MPWKPKKPCKHPGCPNLTDGSYCEAHERAARVEAARAYNQNSRDAELQRFYNSPAWRRLRKLKLQQNPVCEICFAAGRVAGAIIVDHIRAVKDSPEDRLSMDNLQSVCLSCHSRKTRKEEAARRKPENTDN